MRAFEFAKVKEEEALTAKIPEYQTKHSAGADFFCAKEVTIPSIIEQIRSGQAPVPTLVRTGIKAKMEDDEVLELYNRSSNPKKLGLILANSVGVIDADYYGNPDNDGEILFAFYNVKLEPVTIKVGDRIGQGVFKKFLRADGAAVKDVERSGGFGSTGKSEISQ
jgi:dUTP pyrophosphatase